MSNFESNKVKLNMSVLQNCFGNSLLRLCYHLSLGLPQLIIEKSNGVSGGLRLTPFSHSHKRKQSFIVKDKKELISKS